MLYPQTACRSGSPQLDSAFRTRLTAHRSGQPPNQCAIYQASLLGPAFIQFYQLHLISSLVPVSPFPIAPAYLNLEPVSTVLAYLYDNHGPLLCPALALQYLLRA